MTDIKRLRSVLIAPGKPAGRLDEAAGGASQTVPSSISKTVCRSPRRTMRVRRRSPQPRCSRPNTPDLVVFARVNAISTPFFEADIVGLHPHLAGVVVPKVGSSEDVELIREALNNADLGRLSIFAGIENGGRGRVRPRDHDVERRCGVLLRSGGLHRRHRWDPHGE